MRAVVVGGGSWGTAMATLLRDRGHDVVLACRDREQATAIAATAHNPRYAEGADLTGIEATTIDDAPVSAADLVVVAVPSKAFRDVVSALPGSAPVLSLTKGLDPGTGERLSTLVRDRSVAGCLRRR
jgi:glycerol-3-phosphate dehydrogenase (NAD(P)+)